MSWYKDPTLFISGYNSRFTMYKFTKKIGYSPIFETDFQVQEQLSFNKHLALGNNKEKDFDSFKATPLTGMSLRYINCQGSVICWDALRKTGTWSHEEPNSPFWSIPGIAKQKSVAEQALEKKVWELEAKISSLEEEKNFFKRIEKETEAIIENLKAENSELKSNNLKLDEDNKKIKKERDALEDDKKKLKEKLDNLETQNAIIRARADRHLEKIDSLKREDMHARVEVLEKQVSDLTSKLAQCYFGSTGGGSSLKEPWLRGHKVPSNWVRFEELEVLKISKNIPLTITKASGCSRFGEDGTTNVQSNCFYQGLFPLVLVDIAELTPNREEARFDPYVWGSFDNAGTTYAARKLFASEMSGAHKTS